MTNPTLAASLVNLPEAQQSNVKRVRIDFGSLDDNEEIFTHQLNGVYRHFPVRAMRELAEKYGGQCEEIRCVLAPIVKKTVRFIKQQMGIEKWRVKRLEGEYLERPVIAIQWDDGHVTIIDGNHRYVKLHWLGRDSVKMYVFSKIVWEKFALPGNPALNTLCKDSRMREYEQWRKDNGHDSVKIEIVGESASRG